MSSDSEFSGGHVATPELEKVYKNSDMTKQWPSSTSRLCESHAAVCAHDPGSINSHHVMHSHGLECSIALLLFY